MLHAWEDEKGGDSARLWHSGMGPPTPHTGRGGGSRPQMGGGVRREGRWWKTTYSAHGKSRENGAQMVKGRGSGDNEGGKR